MKKSIFFCISMAMAIIFSSPSFAYEVQYMPFVRDAVNPQIQAEIRVRNNENRDVKLSNVKIIYRYEKEGTSPMVGVVDQASVIGVNNSSFRTISSDVFFEFTNQEIIIRFKDTAGTLKDKDSVSVQFRARKQDWSNHNQSNDPSFNPTLTSLTTVTTIFVNEMTPTVTVTGQIKTINNTYLNNATVKIGQILKATDAQGKFSMAVPAAAQYSVSISANGYASTHRVYKSNKNIIPVFEKLLPVDTTEIINPGVANTVSTLDGASVSFPPLSGITENLSVSLTSINAATREISAAPGNFSATDRNGVSVELISQGMLDVVVRGVTTGTVYSLKDKGPFTIKIPASRLAKATPTQPLWFYDEVSGKWIEEGLATLSNGVYVGNVTHFSTWNVDEPGCLTDQTCGCVNGFILDDSNANNDPTHLYTITSVSEGRSDTRSNVSIDGNNFPNFTIINIPKVSTSITVTNQTTGWSQTVTDVVQGPSPTACSNFDFLMVETIIPVTGLIEDACTNAAAANATVSLFKDSGVLFQEKTTATNGVYSINARQNTDYYLNVSKPGYKALRHESLNIAREDRKVISKIMLVPDSSILATVSGKVVNAQTDAPVANAAYEVRSGLNNYSGPVIASGVADATGSLNLSLPSGGYTIAATASDMGKSYTDLYALSCKQSQTKIALPPKSKNISIILRWGASPADLDAHLTGPLGGTNRYHVFYSQRSVAGEASLDLDDTDGVGPETITVTNQRVDGSYVFSVHNYSALNTTGNTGLSASLATVDVYSNGTLLQTFDVPTNMPGNLWRVFEIKNGIIMPINTITNTSQPAQIQ